MTALYEATGYDTPETRQLAVPSIPRQRTSGARSATVSTARHADVPRPRAADTGRNARVRARSAAEPLAAVAPDALTTALAVPEPRSHRRAAEPRRRVAAPRRRVTAPRQPRRPSVLLAALVAGGLVAGWLGFADADEPAGSTAVLAAQDQLVAEDELELMPMASITEAQAQARLDEVAASRQDRAEAEADAKAAAEAARLAAIEAARPKTVAPVKGARLTSTFGPRWGTYHYGIDLAAPMHTPEYAAADGVVLRAGAASGFGLVVHLLHENGDVTVYGHMDSILVAPGDYVEAGDTIALLGNRGQSTGPHLHFEVHQGGEGGTRIDPVGWLAARGVHL